jgi:hypothetical protein
MAKDTALDNLWHTIDDTFIYKTVGSRPAKMQKKSGSTLLSKRTKLQGYLTYFIPKDKSGKQIGKPQRFLRIQKMGQTTNDFVPFDVVTPYYEDIVKNKNYWTALGGANVVALAQRKLTGIDPNAIASKFSGANGISIPDFGINSNLLDDSGLLNQSNNDVNVYSSVSALETISNPDVSIVDAETMNQAYKESGSKTPFRDWLSTEGGRGVVNEFTKLMNAIVNNNQSSTNNGLPVGNTSVKKEEDEPKSETKILGMSPVTFGIVALGVIAVGSVVTIMLLKNKNAKLKAS